MNFSQAQKAHGVNHHAPVLVVTVEPKHFAQSWPQRPDVPLQIGLKLLSEMDERNATAEAEQRVTRFDHDDIENELDTYNSILMAAVLCRSFCDPTDIEKPLPLFPVQDPGMVQTVFASQTIRYLFDELEKAKLEHGLVQPEASDEELKFVCEQLAGPWKDLTSKSAQRRIRRFGWLILDSLNQG